MASPAPPPRPEDTGRDRPPEPARARRPIVSLEEHQITGTRVGGIWIASILFTLVLLLLLIFILQNSTKVEISFFGLEGHTPLGVALLLAAVLGVLLVVIPGTARIVQLRMTARRHSSQDALRRDETADPPRPV